MNLLNSVLHSLTSLLMEPLAGWPAQVSLVVWSAVTGVGMAWVFGKTSNQPALETAANRIKAQLFAVKLFKDDFRVMLRAQSRLLKAVTLRLWYSLPPMLVLIVPMILLLTHLACWYEHRPLLPGEPAVVQMQLVPSSWETAKQAVLEAPEGVSVETDVLRDEYSKTLYWRVLPKNSAPVTLRWRLGDDVVEKQLVVAKDSAQLMPISIHRPGSKWIDRLLYPAEPGFSSDSPVRSIEVQHPMKTTPILGLELPWWLTFFIVSMLAAVLAKPWLNVRF